MGHEREDYRCLNGLDENVLEKWTITGTKKHREKDKGVIMRINEGSKWRNNIRSCKQCLTDL